MSDLPTPTQKLSAALAAASTAVAGQMEMLQQAWGALNEVGLTMTLITTVEQQDPGVLVPHFPNEPKTGADLMWFVKQGSGSSNQVFLIQAKRLDPLTLRYLALDHTVGKNGQRQVDLLIDTAAGIEAEVAGQGGFAKPFYFFYNYSPLSSADNGVFYLPADVVQTLIARGEDSLAELKATGFYQPLSAFAAEAGLG